VEGKRKEEGEGKKKEKGRGRWKEESLRKVGRTDARMDTQVILYSVQCYALHWTDNNGNNNDDADDAVLTSDADLGVVLNAAEL